MLFYEHVDGVLLLNFHVLCQEFSSQTLPRRRLRAQFMIRSRSWPSIQTLLKIRIGVSIKIPFQVCRTKQLRNRLTTVERCHPRKVLKIAFQYSALLLASPLLLLSSLVHIRLLACLSTVLEKLCLFDFLSSLNAILILERTGSCSPEKRALSEKEPEDADCLCRHQRCR